MKKIILLSILFFTQNIFAQNFEVCGTVVDSQTKEPIFFTYVVLKNAEKIGAITDIDGKFCLEIPDSIEKILEVQFVGYRNQTIILEDNETNILIELEEEVYSLETVTVTQSKFGKKKRKGKSNIREKSSKEVQMEREVRPEVMSESVMDYSSDADVMVASDGVPIKNQGIKAGTLTAGEVNDFAKWEMWEDIAENDLKRWREKWQIYPKNRYSVQVKNEAGFAIVDAKVVLKNSTSTIWEARTDNTGKAELWFDIFNKKENEGTNLKIEVSYNGKKEILKEVTEFQQGINHFTLNTSCETTPHLDICFVVDATGSMSDEINYLKTEVNDVIGRVKKAQPDFEINTGAVFYRDLGDEYVTRKSDFSVKVETASNFINEQYAAGGGDTPEAVERGLDVTINDLKWSEKATTRIVFLILDAPPHPVSKVMDKLETIVKKSAKKGIRIVPITGSGIDKGVEYLMRSYALATNGTYTFLTDDSGVGGAHIKPTTDDYDVEKLNDLMVRIITQYTETAECSLDEIAKTDIDPIETKELISKIYPNPTQDVLNVEVNKKLPELFLTDANGKILERYTDITEGKKQLNLIQYPTGIYFLRFLDKKDKVITKKVVVAR